MNIDLLCTEASLDIHFLSPDDLFDIVKDMPLDRRVSYVQNYYNKMAVNHELIFRRYLSATLLESTGSKKKIRGARRVETMDLILDSLTVNMSKKDAKHLKHISTVLMGIEPVIVAKDVCGLSNQQAQETLSWAVNMILKGIKSPKKR